MEATIFPRIPAVKAPTWRILRILCGQQSDQASQGLLFTLVPTYGLDPTKNAAAAMAAERHVHYFHGVNPLSKVFLSNVNAIGASNSVTSLYHSWFAPDTDWSIVGVSKYGPAPGYLVGGANPSYALDVCCPAGCGSATNNALCVNPIPPAGQPPMKSYKDFQRRLAGGFVAGHRA